MTRPAAPRSPKPSNSAPRKSAPRDSTPRSLTPRRKITALLEGALERSAADETELVWLEAWQARARIGRGGPEIERRRELTVLVRVIDRGRVGSHRTGAATAGDLDNAVRAAVAQSRSREPLPGLLHLPSDDGALPRLAGLRDERIAALDEAAVASLAGGSSRRVEGVRLRWADARVAVYSSRGLRRGVSVSAIELAVRAGDGPGRGLAVDAARTLEALPVTAVFERARARRGEAEPGESPAEIEAAVLSPEATAGLVVLLTREALSAAAYYEGSSLLREHLGVQVFDRAIDLVDDATDPRGLPFPFDLEGTPKRRVELIGQGIPRTPALDQRQAAVLGLQPTAHAIGGADARAENLFLLPGEHDDDALLGLADGGIWVGQLASLECFEPRRLQIRAVLGGLRRIRDGRLAEPLPDRIWQASLVRALASVRGVGSTPSRSLGAAGYLGGISAPAMAIGLG
jgi:predicted Zn-dependent protease